MDAHNNPFQFDMNYTSLCSPGGHHLLLVAEHQGIEESSGKAMRVMQITTVMVVILLIWGVYRSS